MSILRIARERDGMLQPTGQAWQEDGTLACRSWSEAAKEKKDPSGVFYCWKGEWPGDAKAPPLDGTGEIRVESVDRSTGYSTTRSDSRPKIHARTAGVYLRADPEDVRILDRREDQQRARLIAERLKDWKAIAST